MGKLTRVKSTIALFKSKWNNTISRLLQSKLDEVVSITDFDGVVGDSNESGTTGTDCTAGLQMALNSGCKSLFIPEGYYRVTGTIKIPSGVSLKGASMYSSCIVASPEMDGVLDVIQNVGYSSEPMAFDYNISLSNFRIKANGFSRTKSSADKEWGRGLRTGALVGLQIDKLVVEEGPQHCIDIACWKDSYVGVGHAGVVKGKTTDVVINDSYVIDYCFDDGLTTHGVDGVSINNVTSIITDYAKSRTTYKITQNGVEIDDGSCNVTVSNCRAYANNTISKGFSVANHADNPIPYNVQFTGCHTYEAVAGVSLLGVGSASHVFGEASFRGRGYRIVGCSLNYPSVEATNTEFPTRSFDIQSCMDVYVKDFRVVLGSVDGATSRTPCAVANIIGSNVEVDGLYVSGVPQGNLGTSFGTGRAWFRITNNKCSNIKIKNVEIDNIGWADRVIRDVDLPTGGGALVEVAGVTVHANSTDGHTKTLVMSKALAKFSRLKAPTSIQRLRTGRTLTDRSSLFSGDVKYNYPDVDTIVGGLRIFSETAQDNSQPSAGILFDRQFSSISNNLGKGSIAFRTSESAKGALSFTALDEDTGNYVPLMALTYTNTGVPTKAVAPIGNGDMNLGQAVTPWLNIYSKNAPQTISDARLKTSVRKLTDKEVAAGLEIMAGFGVWSWTDGVGDRLHAGTTVQEVIRIMDKHGLSPFDYSFVCYDEWEATYMEGALVKQAGNSYSFKVQELHMFVLACLASSLRPN